MIVPMVVIGAFSFLLQAAREMADDEKKVEAHVMNLINDEMRLQTVN